MDNLERYSLVAAYKRSNGELLYYRFADVNPITKKLVEAEYRTENFDVDYEPVTLFSKVHKEPYKAVLKKWKYDAYDNRKQYIKEDAIFHGKAYEVVYLEDEIENKDFKEEYIRETFYNGFAVDNVVNNEFMLIVGQDSNKLVALLCLKTKFKTKKAKDEIQTIYYIDKNETDPLHNISSLSMYKLATDSILSNDNLLDHPFSNRVIDTVRYFYEEVKLPAKNNVFLIRSIDDYSIRFFSKYFKSKKDLYRLTNKERSRFIDILEELDYSDKELEEYFAKTGYDIEDVKAVVEQAGKKIVTYLHGDDELGHVLRDYLLYDGTYYDECLEEVKNRWEKSADFETKQKELEERLFSLLKELDESTNELTQVKSNVEELKNKKELILKEVEELYAKKSTLSEDIKNALSSYKTDLVSLIRESTVIEEFTGKSNISAGEVQASKGYMHRSAKPIADTEKYDDMEIENYEDFIDGLIDNLSINYTDKKSRELTGSIIASFMNYKGIVIDESLGELISNAISKLINKRNADKYIITGEVDIKKISISISRSSTDVVYFDGVLNNYNESLLKYLVKTFPRKIFIFGIDENIVESCSKGLWNYASYIEVGNGFMERTSYKPIISECDLNTIKIEIRKNKKKYNGEEIKNLKLLKDNQFNKIVSMFNTYGVVIDSTNIPTFIINQIVLLSSKRINQVYELFYGICKKEKMRNTILAHFIED